MQHFVTFISCVNKCLKASRQLKSCVGLACIIKKVDQLITKYMPHFHKMTFDQ